MVTAKRRNQKVKAKSLIYDEEAYGAMGFRDLADDVPVGSVSCTVLERPNPLGEGWEYKVVACDASGVRRVVDPDSSITSVPEIVELSDMLVKAKLLKRRPPLDYEWAINVDGSNDFDSNFPHEALRDRAVDELFISGYLTDPINTDIVLFEIEANGDQLNESDVEFVDWIKSRDLLAEFGCENDHSGAQTRLLVGLLTSDADAIKKALRAGADPRSTDDTTMRTALHKVSWSGNAEIARIFLEHGAEVDAKDAYGNTPLHFAASSGRSDICHELWKSGANVGEVNGKAQTAVEVAKMAGHTDTANLLRTMVSRQFVIDTLEISERNDCLPGSAGRP